MRFFYRRILEERVKKDIRALSKEELQELLGRARAKKGMFEGDLEEGELEIGQISGLIQDILPASKIMEKLISEFEQAKREVSRL